MSGVKGGRKEIQEEPFYFKVFLLPILFSHIKAHSPPGKINIHSKYVTQSFPDPIPSVPTDTAFLYRGNT